MSKKKIVNTKKNKIREIKSKVKIREIKDKKEPIKSSEDIEDVVSENELGEFLQTVKAPVLGKIANAEELNLEQIAFAQSKDKKNDDEISYLDVKSDYNTTERGRKIENGAQYTESSGDYSTMIEDDKNEKERKRDLSGMRQTNGNVKRKKDWGSWENPGFNPESDSKKYMTGGL